MRGFQGPPRTLYVMPRQVSLRKMVVTELEALIEQTSFRSRLISPEAQMSGVLISVENPKGL